MNVTECEPNQHKNNHYNSLKQDPEALIKLVNSYVKVQVIKDCSYVGFIHSIDPMSYSIILSIPLEETYQTVIIPGHAVLDVTHEDLPDNIKPPQRKQIDTDTMDDILKRKARLVAWFKTNLLPVTELDNKIVLGNVTLLHPYNISDISTENSIVAMQIKNIMERMPLDFVPK